MASPQTPKPPQTPLSNKQDQKSLEFQILSTWPSQDLFFFNSPKMVEEQYQPSNLYKRTNLRFYKQFSIQSDWQDQQISFFSHLQSPAIGTRLNHHRDFARQREIRNIPYDQNINLDFEILSSWSDEQETFFNDLEISRWNNYVKQSRPRHIFQEGQKDIGIGFSILSDWEDEELPFFQGLQQRPVGSRFQDRRGPKRYNRAKLAQDNHERPQRLDQQKLPYLQRKYNFRRVTGYQHPGPKINRTLRVQRQPVKNLSLQQIRIGFRHENGRIAKDQRRKKSRLSNKTKDNEQDAVKLWQSYNSRESIFRDYFKDPKTIAQNFILQLVQENAKIQIPQNSSILPLTQEYPHSQQKNKHQWSNSILPYNPSQYYIPSQMNQNFILKQNSLKKVEGNQEDSPKLSFTSAIMSSDCEFSESEAEKQVPEAWPRFKPTYKKRKKNVKNTKLKLDLVIMGFDANELVDQEYEIVQLLDKQNILSWEEMDEECTEQSKQKGKERGYQDKQGEQIGQKQSDTNKLFRRAIMEAMNYYTEQSIKWIQRYYDKTKKHNFISIDIPARCFTFLKTKFPTRLVAEGEWCYANLLLASNLQFIQYTATNKEKRQYLPFIKEHIARQAHKEKYFMEFLKNSNDQFWQDLHKSVLQPYARHTTFDSIFQYFIGRLEVVVKKIEGQTRTNNNQGRQKEREKMFLQRYKKIITRFKSQKPKLDLEKTIYEFAAINNSAIEKIDKLIQQITL